MKFLRAQVPQAATPSKLNLSDVVRPRAWWVSLVGSPEDGSAWTNKPTELDLATIRATTGREIEVTELGDVAAERERCAMKLQVTRSDVLLAAGELSAQEWRTCAAVLRWMQTRIRAT
jgi:hypothetical protein